MAMNNLKHLSDTILQDYIDGNLAETEAEVISHLDSCQICQARLKEYKQLYGELDIDPIPSLSKEFSHSVMAQIAIEENSDPVHNEEASGFVIPSPVYAVVGAIAALAAIIYFIDLKPLFGVFTGSAISEYISSAILANISKAAEILNFDISLVAMVTLALIIIGGIDYIVKRYKHSTASFFA